MNRELREIVRENFAANLNRLMENEGFRGAALASALGVTRQSVSLWRLGQGLPTPVSLFDLLAVLQCTRDELFRSDCPAATMMPLVEWAKRERISPGRAKNLFSRGILTGDKNRQCVNRIHVVPCALRAPADSGRLVREQRRLRWVAAFRVNIDDRMRELDIPNIEMAEAMKVSESAISRWRSGRGYPVQDRLETIASLLDWTVEQLLSPPDPCRTTRWRFHYCPTPRDVTYEVA